MSSKLRTNVDLGPKKFCANFVDHASKTPPCRADLSFGGFLCVKGRGRGVWSPNFAQV